jgi:hypothetical protein
VDPLADLFLFELGGAKNARVTVDNSVYACVLHSLLTMPRSVGD